MSRCGARYPIPDGTLVCGLPSGHPSDFHETKRAGGEATTWRSSSAARDGDSEGLRDELTEALRWHMTDRDESSGCALRCGYADDDRAEHLADALLAGPLRQLVTERDEAVAAVERVREIHRPIDHEGYPADGADLAYCDGDGFVWPCPSIRALNGGA